VDLNLIVVLLTLLETRSVTKTAVRSGLSQPAVSGALAKLRVIFNDALAREGGNGDAADR
jgi:DNA-binding transcriptional LysR family regulator